MIRNLFIFYLVFNVCCSQYNNNKSIATTAESETIDSIALKYYTTEDTVIIQTEFGDTLKFTKQTYNEIIKNHPELYNYDIKNYEYPDPPDYTYHCNVDGVGFGSEQGQDLYYTFYAYFLKVKNGAKKNAAVRKRINETFICINKLFSLFEYGGTGFSHQYYRIPAYAEYSVYLYSDFEEFHEKTYDIKKQKEIYLQSLWQLIDDESSIDFESIGQQKIERTKRLYEFVNTLDSLITDIFYLRRAQAFHYGQYEYY